VTVQAAGTADDIPGDPDGADVGKLDLTDIGNGRRMAADHGPDIRFLDAGTRGYWRVWNGRHWIRDETREVRSRAQATAVAILDDLRSVDDAADRKKLLKHALDSQSDYRIRAMMRCAEAEPGIAVLESDFDLDPWALNVGNGTIDLRTGCLHDHDRRDMLTKLAPVEFDASARCPRWEAFVSEIMNGDRGMVEFLQRAVGYSLTGDTFEQVLFLLHGSGANGKSTFLELLHAMLGDYAWRANAGTFCEQRGDRPRPDIAGLVGKRMVTALEIGEGGRLSEPIIKSVTGSDTLTARHLFEREFEFVPQFKLWLAANHKPEIRATDHAMWRRVLLIPFDVTFDGAARDDQLGATLRSELPGILQWALEGCRAWLVDRDLRAPERVAAATAEYREESDVLAAFIDECCETGTTTPPLRESARALFQAYRRWSESNSETAMNQTAFGIRLSGLRYQREKIGGRFIRFGIRLRPAREQDGCDGLDGLWQGTYTRARNVNDCKDSPNGPTVLAPLADVGTRADV
jgi:putative DNA primase/helicase